MNQEWKDEEVLPSLANPQPASQSDSKELRGEPPKAYRYPHATDHPPVAPIPAAPDHEVESYGGVPEGGT